MPTYDYSCDACGHTFERRCAVADRDKPKTCEKCGRTNTHRLVSASTGFVLKGSGWYRDGYASER